MPPIGQIHIDQALTNLSIMYKNTMYQADQIAPIVPVPKRSDKYFQYRKEDYLNGNTLDVNGRAGSLRRPGAEAAEIDYQQTTGNYNAEEYAYRGIVTDAEAKLADVPLAPEADQTLQLSEWLLVDWELMVANLAMTRANYPSSNKATLTTGGTGTSWAQYSSANSNPFSDIKNGKLAVVKGIVRDATDFALTIGAAKTLADHPLLKDLVKYTNQDALTREGLPKVVRGLNVIELAAQKNTAAPGAPYSGNYIWQADNSTDAGLIFYRNPDPTLRGTAFIYTFEAPDDTTEARGLAIRKWREDKRKGTMIEASFLRDFKAIGVDSNGKLVAGYLIDSATV